MIGLASYAFDLSSEQLQSACRIMDSMIASWNRRNLKIGYPTPTSPEDTDLDAETEVPDSANEAIYTNLALRLASTIGRSTTSELKQSAYQSYQALLAKAVRPREMQYPETLPRGAGNKPWRWEDNYNEEPYTYQPWDEKYNAD